MRIFISSLVIGFACQLSAQEHFCGATEAQNHWFNSHPQEKAHFDQLQQQAAEWDQQAAKNGYKTTGDASARPASASVYTVPVVFHILHTGGGENISDAQVRDAVSILTRDFNKRNADTIDVVSQYTNNIGNPKIEFQLATRDPNGNCTNGIIRHWDTNTDWIYGFNNNGFAGYVYTWPATKYLNVYVVKTMASGFAGYTYNPGAGIPAAADAVVILHNYVGSIGTGAVGTSRALTHEVGHWLNLAHTWGSTNNPNVACGDDGVSDTPITKGNTSCNLNAASICNPPIVENMQNYMEYAYCQKMYTNGQSVRMVNAINSSVNGRNNLSTANNLSVTGVTNPASGCIPNLEIAALPSATICVGRSISLASYTFNASPSSYAWTGNDALITSPSASLTTVTFTSSGTKTVNCQVSSSSGSNNQTASITVVDAAPQVTGNYLESFEGGVVPNHWTIINPTASNQSWVIDGDGASDGIYSAFIPGETFNADAISILESPSYDFKNNPNAIYSFKYAYAKQSGSNKDKFKVQASKDCGGTWTDVYVPNNTNMSSGSGGVTSTLYFPSASEWKYYDGMTNLPVFSPFKNETNVKIRFWFQEDVDGTGHGNRLYLDQINFNTPTGINEITQQIGLNVYPNPSSAAFNLSFTLSSAARIKYQVVSVTGAVLIAESEKTMSEGTHDIRLNANDQLSAGIYFVNLEMNGVKMSKKIVIGD